MSPDLPAMVDRLAHLSTTQVVLFGQWILAAGMVGIAILNWRLYRRQRQLLANDRELLAHERQLHASHVRLGEHLSSIGQMLGPDLRELRAELRAHTTSDLLHSPTDPPVNPEAVPPPHPTPRHARAPAPTAQTEPREGTP